MTDNIDIVIRLRAVLHNDRSVELMNYEAAEEIMQLRQQMKNLRGERDESMTLVETIVHDVNVLSTRPAAAIKLNDLVAHINEWGDSARKILKES